VSNFTSEVFPWSTCPAVPMIRCFIDFQSIVGSEKNWPVSKPTAN
jgi:hypothetical protein